MTGATRTGLAPAIFKKNTPSKDFFRATLHYVMLPASYKAGHAASASSCHKKYKAIHFTAFTKSVNQDRAFDIM